MDNMLDSPKRQLLQVATMVVLQPPHMKLLVLISRDIDMTNEIPPKRTLSRITSALKFVMKDKKRLEQLVKELCYLNDSLHKLAPGLDQESSRRRLRTFLSTNDIEQLH